VLYQTTVNLRLVKSSGRLLRTAVCIYGADLWKLNLCCLIIFPLGGADSSTVPNQTPVGLSSLCQVEGELSAQDNLASKYLNKVK
jgi:hypothetical protein